MSDEIILPTGRVISPVGGVIGIDRDGDLFGGYDGRLEYDLVDRRKFGGHALTPGERIFIANMMIARWHQELIGASDQGLEDELNQHTTGRA